ncbi:hypothetical protein VSR82_36985 [Burkholderia sp. JPY481]
MSTIASTIHLVGTKVAKLNAEIYTVMKTRLPLDRMVNAMFVAAQRTIGVFVFGGSRFWGAQERKTNLSIPEN